MFELLIISSHISAQIRLQVEMNVGNKTFEPLMISSKTFYAMLCRLLQKLDIPMKIVGF